MYSYRQFQKDVQNIRELYPTVEVGSIGKSVLGKELTYIRLGEGKKEFFYNAAHHSLEWITSVLLMRFVRNFLYAREGGDREFYKHVNVVSPDKLRQYDLAEISKQCSMYIVPMVNPDGVDLVLEGVNKSNIYYDEKYYQKAVMINQGCEHFGNRWQANIRGVDLNHNYDASWHMSKQAAADMGIKGPNNTRYAGEHPESEPESKAVADFTRAHNFDMVLAYHSQGEVIFYNYMGKASGHALNIAKEMSRMSGYALDQATGIASHGGFKDWFIDKYQKPGYTIEVGIGKNPLPIEQIDKIYHQNIGILLGFCL